MVYLDYAASAPILPEAADALNTCQRSFFANPSAAYAPADAARRILNAARRSFAASICAEADEIVFTSGGTESNNLALFGVCRTSGQKKHLIVGATEHHSVLSAAKALHREFFSVSVVPCDKNGVISPSSVARAIRPETALISVQYANNETGVVQPVRAIGILARSRHIPFHCDAVSAYGEVPIDVRKSKIDLLSVSAHKLGGPKGAGFLYIRNGIPFLPLFCGGPQENARRPGTENVPAIAGFHKAAELSAAHSGRAESPYLRDRLQALLTERLPDIRVNSGSADRLPYYLSITIPGSASEKMLYLLGRKGIYASAGAACATREHAPSHVLTAMGLTQSEANSTLRLSLGKLSTLSDVAIAADAIAYAADASKIIL
jgi:cysteine desulfurase